MAALLLDVETFDGDLLDVETFGGTLEPFLLGSLTLALEGTPAIPTSTVAITTSEDDFTLDLPIILATYAIPSITGVVTVAVNGFSLGSLTLGLRGTPSITGLAAPSNTFFISGSLVLVGVADIDGAIAGTSTPVVPLTVEWAGPAPEVDWTMTREMICDRAMKRCGALGVGETPTAEERALCLESLEMILKNLQWRGYSWPKTVAQYSIINLVADTQAYALPPDAYGDISFYIVNDQGQRRQLTPLTKLQWDDITKLSEKADGPLWVYVDNYNIARFWPVPARSRAVQLNYRKIILNTVPGEPVDLDSPWMMGLIYGLAAEIGYEFGVEDVRVERFRGIWEQQIKLGIGNTIGQLPDRVSVDC